MTGKNNGRSSLFSDCAVMSLSDGFLAYEASKDRSHDWRFSNFYDVAREEFRSSGFHLFTVLNIASYLRFRRRYSDDPILAMRERFEYELSVGMVEAIGYPLPRQESHKPVLIPHEVWKHCVFDWDRAEVEGAGFKFTYIRILMPYSSALLKDTSFNLEPLPDLGVFAPSDAQRKALGLEAIKTRRTTKTTYREQILRAFEELGDDGSRTDQQLAHEIRKLVKQWEGLTSDKSLGDDAILKHIRRHRQDQRKK